MNPIWRSPELNKRFSIPSGTALSTGSLLLVNDRAEMLFVRLDEVSRWEVPEEQKVEALVDELGQAMNGLLQDLVAVFDDGDDASDDAPTLSELLPQMAASPDTFASELMGALEAEDEDPDVALDALVGTLAESLDSPEGRELVRRLHETLNGPAPAGASGPSS